MTPIRRRYPGVIRVRREPASRLWSAYGERVSARPLFLYDLGSPYAYLAAERVNALFAAATGEPPEWQPMDPDGILMKEIDGTLYYHPVELADATYRMLNAYGRTHDEGYLDWARRYLEKIRALSVPSDGALFVPYQFDFAPHGVTAPWYSGMAQGMALTVFVRMYRLTGESTYLETAQAS